MVPHAPPIRFVASLLFLVLPAVLRAATNDNNVEWDGVSSLPESRSPRQPGRGESFVVEIRVFKGDLSAVKVRTWDGSEHFHPLAWNRNEGQYDVWRGTVSGTTSDYLYYRFDLTDGSDTDYYNALGMWD